jgi:hypothetical protein
MKLEVLIGMIGSGKSTYARSRAAEGAMIVCHDDLTEMLHGQYRYEPGLKPVYRNMMIDLAWHALMEGRDVVVDRTHLTRESRALWVETVGSWNGRHIRPRADLIAVTFPVENPLTHAGRRYYSDPRGRTLDTWREVAEHHYRQWLAEPLNWPAEGFDGVVTPAFEFTGPKVPVLADCTCGARDAMPDDGATLPHVPSCPMAKEVAGG